MAKRNTSGSTVVESPGKNLTSSWADLEKWAKDNLLDPSLRLLYLGLFQDWSKCGIPPPIRELQFIPGKRHRADYAWPVQKVILEQEGGIWVKGRHTRGQGFINDIWKYNKAVELGYVVLRCSPPSLQPSKPDIRLNSIEIRDQLLEVLHARSKN